jgi:hypothetical protein
MAARGQEVGELRVTAGEVKVCGGGDRLIPLLTTYSNPPPVQAGAANFIKAIK